MLRPVRILIADDQPRARMGLRALLATWPGTGSVREAADGHEAVRAAAEWRPELVLLDARMPHMDGVLAALTIKARWPDIKVVVLSMFGEYRGPALAAGADAFVSKGQAPDEFLDVLAALVENRALAVTWPRQ